MREATELLLRASFNTVREGVMGHAHSMWLSLRGRTEGGRGRPAVLNSVGGDTHLHDEVSFLSSYWSDGLAVFRHFLRSEFSEENLDFWLAVERFKKTHPVSKMAAKAAKIYDEFISTSAGRQVPVCLSVCPLILLMTGHVTLLLSVSRSTWTHLSENRPIRACILALTPPPSSWPRIRFSA